MSENTQYFSVHSWMMDAFLAQQHPPTLGVFQVVVEKHGPYDAKITPATTDGVHYFSGWLAGRQSVYTERQATE